MIRVLVVDDSAFLRKVVRSLLEQASDIEVVAVARDGLEALAAVEEYRPDVITLDLHMPRMDGVEFLEALPAKGIPVIVVSIASRDGSLAARAAEAGAFDFVRKPTALASDDVAAIGPELIEKVRMAASTPFPWPQLSKPRPLASAATASAFDAVVMVLSTGGPRALRHLLAELPADFPVPLAVVLHMPEGYTASFAERLNELSQVEVLEAEDSLEMRPGRVLLGRAGRHLKLERKFGRVLARLALEPATTPYRPSGDVLFRSAAEVYAERLLGVVMTGIGDDGTTGAAWIKARGGRVLAEAQSSAVVYGMPRAVVQAGLADETPPLEEMSAAIMCWIERGRASRPGLTGGKEG